MRRRDMARFVVVYSTIVAFGTALLIIMVGILGRLPRTPIDTDWPDEYLGEHPEVIRDAVATALATFTPNPTPTPFSFIVTPSPTATPTPSAPGTPPINAKDFEPEFQGREISLLINLAVCEASRGNASDWAAVTESVLNRYRAPGNTRSLAGVIFNDYTCGEFSLNFCDRSDTELPSSHRNLCANIAEVVIEVVNGWIESPFAGVHSFWVPIDVCGNKIDMPCWVPAAEYLGATETTRYYGPPGDTCACCQ